MVNNNNVQNVKFLRNGVVFGPSNDKTARQVALDAMEQQKANLADGTAILGRYKETNGVVKTLVGFAYISDDAKTLTVFDVDGAGADVDKKIKTAIEALNAEITSSEDTNVKVKVTEVGGKITAVNITTDNTVNSGDVATAIETEIGKLEYSDTAVDGQYVSQVSETDGIIAVTRVALPTVAAISDAGKPITAVSESLGEISATTGTIDAQYVNINDAGGIITADNVEGALAEIAAEIDAMDKEASAEDGQVVTTVSESDGKVSEIKANVKDLQLGGYSKETSATGDIASTDTINAALSKLENKAAAITIANADGSINVKTGATGTDINVNINSGEKVLAKTGNAGLYTDIKLSGITPSSTTVKEEFALIGTDGSQLGTSIKVYKDSHIVSITYITDSGSIHYQNLEYKYIDADGVEQTEYVDISSLVLEAEFASGVTATDHVVHGVVDSTSEKDSSNNSFLTVGANGFKVDGIKGEIDTKINALNATVGSTDVEGGKHVAVQVVEGAGKLTAVTVNEKNIADANKLADLSGKTVTEVASSNGSIAATLSAATNGTKHLDIITDASKIKMSGFTNANAFTSIKESSSVTEALLEVDNVITEKAEVISTALNGLEATKAEKTALDAEIKARKAVDGQNGDKYSANANANYIGSATSLNDADIKLDAALKAVDDAMLTGVAAGYGITVTNKEASKSQTISVKVKDGDDGIVNDETGLHLGTIDCGTY